MKKLCVCAISRNTDGQEKIAKGLEGREGESCQNFASKYFLTKDLPISFKNLNFISLPLSLPLFFFPFSLSLVDETVNFASS